MFFQGDQKSLKVEHRYQVSQGHVSKDSPGQRQSTSTSTTPYANIRDNAASGLSAQHCNTIESQFRRMEKLEYSLGQFYEQIVVLISHAAHGGRRPRGMSTSKLEPAAFFTPATCFTVACVAFSLVALSIVWRNSKNTLGTRASDAGRSPSRPQPQRRVAADSLYAETRDSYGPEGSPRNRETQIAELVLLSAQAAQLLRSFQQESAQTRIPVVDLLNEISILTTPLCRLQQEFLRNPSFLSQGTLSACFEATSSSIQATLLSL